MCNFLKIMSACLFSAFLLTGCIPATGGTSSDGASSEITVINELFPKIIKSVNNRDIVALRELYAETVLSEYEQFDEDAKVLFEFVDGEVSEYPSKIYPSTRTSYDKGEHISVSESFPYVETDNGIRYQCYLQVCMEDTENLDNVGIHMIEFIRVGDEIVEKQFASLGIDNLKG